MSSNDARFLRQDVQEYLRQQAIRLRRDGKSFTRIGEYLGVYRHTVSRWWQQYQEAGEAVLVQQRRGRKLGEGRTLSEAQEAVVQQQMESHFPEELGIESALWTRRAVQSLIQQQSGVMMPIRSVGEYLRRWGYTPQKPLKRAYEQAPQAVEQWLKTDYPAIEQRAKLESAEIAWGDESGLRSETQTGRGYAPVGETPEIHLSQKNRVRVNFVASISNQGTVRFRLYTCKLTPQVFIQFLARLIRTSKRKVFWIVDKHPVHRSSLVQQWLTDHAAQIEMFYLPSYAPQLNPVEYLNGDVKQGVHSKPPTRNLTQLKQRLKSHLHKLQKLPARIRKYFEHPFIAYAAA
jgi:transposase